MEPFKPTKQTVVRINPKGKIKLRVPHSDGTIHYYYIGSKTGINHGKIPNKEEQQIIGIFRKNLKNSRWPTGANGTKGPIVIVDKKRHEEQRIKEEYEKYRNRNKRELPKLWYQEKEE